MIRGVRGRTAATVTTVALALTFVAPATPSMGAAADDPVPVGAKVVGSVGKLDGALRRVVTARSAGIVAARAAAVSTSAAIGTGDDVLVRVDFSSASFGTSLADAANAGLRVTASTAHAPRPTAEGWISAAALTSLASLPTVRSVVAVHSASTDLWPGSVVSQGDAAHRGPQARALLPDAATGGTGVTVGVVSDSIDNVGGGVADSQATGDLPDSVVINSEAGDGIDEGRAMAEVIYDLAPGVGFAFSTGSGGAVAKAASIAWLASPSGGAAKVIADDSSYLDEPFFQDGVVSRAVDAAQRDHDVLYVASAGNRGRQSWEHIFVPSDPGADSPWMNFASAGLSDREQRLGTIADGGSIRLVVQWDDRWGSATHDLDAYLRIVGVGGRAGLLAFSEDNNVLSGIPRETLTWTNTTGSPVTIGFLVRKYAGTGDPQLKWIAESSASTAWSIEYATNSPAINPDAAAARGAIAVAAVAADSVGVVSPLVAEAQSSRGPVTRLFDGNGTRLASPDVRAKPDVAGADQVTTTVPQMTTFAGTSAAVAHVAAIAALARSVRADLSATQVQALLRDTDSSVSDCSATGWPDADCGYGFVFADRVIDRAIAPGPPVIEPTPTVLSVRNGWYRKAVRVSFTVTSPSTITSTSGCAPVTISSDTAGAAVTCSATNLRGTASRTTVVKLDTTSPTKPTIPGVGPRKIQIVNLPERASCVSTDSLSGVDTCVVTGFSRTAGTHTVTAIATDAAGNTRTTRLTYEAVRSATTLRGWPTGTVPSGTATVAVFPAAGRPVAVQVLRCGTPTTCVWRTVRTVVTRNVPIASTAIALTAPRGQTVRYRLRLAQSAAGDAFTSQTVAVRGDN